MDCVERCRTSPKSLRGDMNNQYSRRQFHHCYLRPDLVEGGKVPANESMAVYSRVGESCAAACDDLDMVCLEGLFQHINTCAAMQPVFSCKTCVTSPNANGVAPSYVSIYNTKDQGKCEIAADLSTVRCDKASKYQHRYCVCFNPEHVARRAEAEHVALAPMEYPDPSSSHY
jgi:hypothetical protein